MTGVRDVEAVVAVVRARLVQGLAPHLQYHGLAHTEDDVVPTALRIAEAEGAVDHELLLVRTAAWFHDAGFVVRRVGHEEVGADFAAELLPSYGYEQADIVAVQQMIGATKLPQTPTSALGAALADADLAVLGRDDFFSWNDALRRELAAERPDPGDAAWYAEQAAFVASHRYHTASARSWFDPGRQRHAEELSRLAAGPPDR